MHREEQEQHRQRDRVVAGHVTAAAVRLDGCDGDRRFESDGGCGEFADPSITSTLGRQNCGRGDRQVLEFFDKPSSPVAPAEYGSEGVFK